MKAYRSRAPAWRSGRERRRFKKALEPPALVQLAGLISKCLGMESLPPEMLLKRLEDRNTAFCQDDNYTLWVDCDFIAVASFGSEAVYYLYLTRQHVWEAWEAEREAAKFGRQQALDESLRSQLQGAWYCMLNEWKGYAVRASLHAEDGAAEISAPESRSVTHADLKAPWTGV